MADALDRDATRARSVNQAVAAVNELASDMSESSTAVRAEARTTLAAIAEIGS